MSTPPVAAGVQERDVVPARAQARLIVDELHAAGLQGRQRAAQVVDLVADVVQARAAAVQEPLERGVPARRADLQRAAGAVRVTRGVQERDVRGLTGDVLARARGQAEERRELGAGFVPFRDDDGDVIDSLDLDHL